MVTLCPFNCNPIAASTTNLSAPPIVTQLIPIPRSGWQNPTFISINKKVEKMAELQEKLLELFNLMDEYQMFQQQIQKSFSQVT